VVGLFTLHLFDDLVGSDEQSGRDFETKRFGGLLVDPQLERGRKLDRQVSRFGAFQYLINVVRRANVAPIQIDAVANKSSYFDMS
jgi:hypothetical protein